MKMRTCLAVLSLFLICHSARGEIVATFEDIDVLNDPNVQFDLNNEPFIDNAGGGATGRFQTGGAAFNNFHDGFFDSGFAISQVTENTLPASFDREFAAITGSGSGGSDTYSVAFTFGSNDFNNDPTFDVNRPDSAFVDLPFGFNPVSIDVTNTAYAVSIMTLGDPNNFARAFEAGDFFLLEVLGFSETGGIGDLITDPVEFLLADFQDGASNVVTTWETVDLSSLEGARSLRFRLTSTDTGMFGINTPAYFAVDNLAFAAVPEPSAAILLVLGLLLLCVARWFQNQGLHRAVLFVLVSSGILFLVSPESKAGSFSRPEGFTLGAPDNPIARSSLSIFETSVVSYNPAPGVGPNFRNPTSGIASLGDLYSPVLRPGEPNTPFDRRFRPETGSEPSSFHAGAVNDPFGGDIHHSSDTYGFIGIDAPGSITLGFDVTIVNGTGADFAVFENGFMFGGQDSLFAEFAYVEVSSNGTDFARFASISTNTAPTTSAGSFQGFDVTNVFNLAGKHASNWGTPFDLSDLIDDPLVTAGLLDLNAVQYVRLVDVVGSGPLFDETNTMISGIATDSLGNPILDNWVTYDSSGFDYLGVGKGVGVINALTIPEPASVVMVSIGLGLGVVSAIRRRRSRA